MAKVKSDTLHVKGIDVGIYTEDYRNEYISMRNRNTIEFLGLWESLHNPSFNRVQFDTFRTEAGPRTQHRSGHYRLQASWLFRRMD